MLFRRIVRPLALVAVAVSVATFAVAEPAIASPATSAVSAATDHQSSTQASTQLLVTVAAKAAKAAKADRASDIASAASTASVAVEIGAMPARAEHDAPAVVAPVTNSGSGSSSGSSQKATTSSDTQTGYGCGPALAYLAAHAAPGFTFECPGYAMGNQAMTCVNHAPQCAGQRIIAIAVPCPAAYMNEAHNSWVLIGQATGIDPYGYCH